MSVAALPVFYTPRMVADSESFSPSAAKPKAVVESWGALGIPLEFVAPRPVSEEELCLAYDPEFVREVLACRRDNGFGNRSAAVARSLPYTSGAMLAAAREAIANGAVAVAPCSGFHHAGYARAGGYCTFNGLAVAAQVLVREGAAQRVGILDFDQHYGDGTAEILRRLRLRNVTHYSSGREYHSPRQAKRFLAAIPAILADFSGCDVILYQAGADPHVEDPLGGWLTTEQLAERDRIVFETARAMRAPIAWNLAGGYQSPLRKVLDIHDNTLRACWEVYGANRTPEGPHEGSI
jgi:acetoin utilization deacetylase AcuC-like enzyme